MLSRSLRPLYLSAKKVIAQESSCFYASANILEPSCHLLQLLQRSIYSRSLKLAQQCHGRICSLGFDQNPFLATKLISAYSICGFPGDSCLVFDSVREKNVFVWNSLISGYARNHVFKEAFELFNQICRGNEIMPDDFTFATLLKISAELQSSEIGKVIHCKSIRMGFVSDTVVANSLMSMYNKTENLSNVRKVFDEMAHRSSASWNVLISGYANSVDLECKEDLWRLVNQMQGEGVRPDAFTVSILLPLCGSNTGKWDYGREIHCFVIRNELALDSDIHVGCCLIDMYSKESNVIMGRWVFDQMNFKNVVAWTAMVRGYVQNGEPKEALSLFQQMHLRYGIEPNRVSLLSVLPACSSLAGLMEGKQIHGFAVRKDLYSEVSLRNALIDMYSKCGSLVLARRVFDDDSCKDTITWSSMIAGYGLYGKGQEAIVLFNEMLQHGIEPDDIVLVGVLSACGRSGLVSEGLDIYNSAAIKYGILPTVEICACVVDMLGRSGHLSQALDFICKMPVKPGPSVWGSLFGASVIHGNLEMQDLAYRSLVQLEPKNPSNYVSLSNVHASSGSWDVVAEVRMTMKERGLSKLPGCSWISINGKTHSFYVADKSHPCSNHIYKMLDELVLAMKGNGYVDGFENLT
ncbi:pentatricopeptide repeat-containing protein At3g12770-like [Macadamia integrifolia]|uniref:pentatricopeptide repeat-containing protein At3g12770-like n=1 Tax=Macadamia integrifolia TaxID=60698 RepID=UPI001C4FAC0E|nr:pentatricopeptide repeat-containing protein At3g12770-like [Macadamia integrifolia]